MFNIFKFFKSHSLMSDELRSSFILFKGEHYSRPLSFLIPVTWYIVFKVIEKDPTSYIFWQKIGKVNI